MSDLYNDLKSAGVPIANHESDLYFPVTDQTQSILDRYPLSRGNATRFINQVEGGVWFDVPFAFLPFWERRAAR